MPSDASRERFAEVQRGRAPCGFLPAQFAVGAGLDYYRHTVFEITSDQLGAQATVVVVVATAARCGPQTPAIGWALGMERLLLVLEAASQADPHGAAARLVGKPVPDAYLVNRGEWAETVGLSLARSLRQQGLIVELDGSGSAFAKQFKRADRSRARWALVLGDEEAERGEVRLKPLQQQGEEITVALSGIAAIVETLRTP